MSWLVLGVKDQIAIVVYCGKFPGHIPHGNSKKDTDYVRTPTYVMDEMSELLQNSKPMNVYNKLTLKNDELSGPSSLRQVYDKKYNDGKKHRLQELGYIPSRRNIADHINELDKMLTDGESIVKSIIRDQGKAPCIILYSDEHLTDLKHLCCTGTSILGVDKTCNLYDMHVIATCYKQTTVVKDSTGEAPIFLGPMIIHDNSD